MGYRLGPPTWTLPNSYTAKCPNPKMPAKCPKISQNTSKYAKIPERDALEIRSEKWVSPLSKCFHEVHDS